MLLSDEQKAQADVLRLTYTEMSVALKTHIDPEVYARHKADMQAERDEWERKLTDMDAAMHERAKFFAPHGRGQRPPGMEAPTDTDKETT